MEEGCETKPDDVDENVTKKTSENLKVTENKVECIQIKKLPNVE